ncbi:hypothetical protein [Flexivirga alba]|uniref:Uncharacterized protein n=1 Tax=Flexivirga alba TaxID=702742 RepID=A0ABW2AGP4_9MICO
MSLFPRMDRIVQLHRDRMLALAVALTAAVLLLVMTDLVGSMSWYGLVATLAAGSVVLGNSDSFAGLILLCAMVLQWITTGVDAGSWWVLPAAWLLLVAHVAVALTASGPDQAPIPRAILALWVPRTILVGLATTAVAALALLIEPTNHQLIPYGVAAVLIALVVAVVVMIRLTDDPDTETPGSGQ